MARRKSKQKTPLSKDTPYEFDGLKAGDEVVYKRLSDDKTSVGVVKYFHTNSDPVCVTLIDLSLKNFQTALLPDIDRDVHPKKKRDLLAKILKKG